MELEVYFSLGIVTAVIYCGMYCYDLGVKVPFSLSNFHKFFATLIASFGIALCSAVLSSGLIGLLFLGTIFLPLSALVISVCLTFIFETVFGFMKSKYHRHNLIVNGAVLSVLMSNLLFGEGLVNLTLQAAALGLIYVTAATLLFFVSACFGNILGEKNTGEFLKVTLSATALGFAAEGFKGIFEKLFT